MKKYNLYINGKCNGKTLVYKYLNGYKLTDKQIIKAKEILNMNIDDVIHLSANKIPNRCINNLYIFSSRQSGKALINKLYYNLKLTNEELNYIIKKLNRNTNC